jgi:outer membrane protein assembly factor BamB
VAAAKPAGAELGEREGLTLLRRRGPLDGAGSWTHQYGNAANTCVSEDSLVRAPLGLLWFGGPSNEAVLPRHGHGPPEQVIGGRLFIEGPHILRALDVYTGRLLWQRRLQDLGEHYNYTTHEPGANALGTNFVATRDAVYVAHSRQCLLLDPATGRTARRLILPGGDAQADHAPQWGYLGVWEDLLVAGSTPMKFHTPDLAGGDFSRTIRTTDWRTAFYYTGSRLRALCEEIERWRDFEIERPSAVLQPPPEIEPAREAQPRAAADVDFIVANVNKLIRQQDVLSKLPADVVAGARKRDAREAARWQEASRLDDYYDKPKPDTIDDLQALLGELRASGGTTLEDGRDAHVLRRQILEHCYPYLPRWRRLKVGQRTLDYTASSEVVVMDRRTGKVLWTRRAAAAFRHNAICLGGGKLFCIDRLPTPVAHRLLRRGVKTHRLNHLLAIDIRTGKVLWSTQENAFGTWLSYSAEHDVLLQGGRPSRDMLADETGRRLMALRGASGEVLWDKKAPRTAAGLSSQTDDEDEDDNDEYLWDYQDEDDLPYSGPCMLHGRTIITQSKAFDLLTGEPKMHKHPLTGEPIHWRFRRNYGCNTVIASRHLLTFRSAAAGFFDLAGDGGTGNLGGFKSGCTSNLVVADGVLNAPDYTRTCTCSYQNQSSLALIHMPEADLWTFQDFDRGQQPIRSLGVNFGAPGDRRAANGVLWLEYPFVGGRTPDVDIETDVGGEIDVDRKTLEGLCFRRHASRIRGGGAGGLAWVAASGLEAAAHISVKVASRRAPARAYTVSLHFAEPAWAKKGQRIFDVALMGRTVLKGFDVAAEAGAPLTPVVKTFRKVAVGDKLRIALTPAAGSTLPPVLCGVEIVAEP